MGYWTFNEGSGTIAHDSSPYNNIGTLYNNPILVTGKSGNALQFNGANNYVEVPSSPSLNLTNQVTITAWINPSSIGAYNRIAAKSYTSNSNPWTEYGLLFDNANHIRLEIGTNGQQNAVNGVKVIPTNTWTFVAGTYNGSMMKVYVNGVLDNSYPHTGAIDMDSMPLSIARSGFGYDYFNGKIDEVKVWNRALNASAIMKEYNGTTPQTCYGGTPYGSCSSNKPQYCSNGNLVNNCAVCGCFSGTCQSNGSCASASADLTVYQSSGRIYLQNKAGQVIMNGTDATTVINAAIADAVSGDTVLIEPGNYIIPNGKQILAQHNNITLTLATGAVLVAGSGYTSPWETGLITVANVQNWIVQGGEIDGTNNGDMVGVTVRNCTNVTIQNMYVHNIGTRGYGIFFLMGSKNCKALDNIVTNVGANGMTLGFWQSNAAPGTGDRIMSYNILARGNTVTHCGDVGIDTQGVTGVTIDNNVVAYMDTYNGFNNGHWGVGQEVGTSGLIISNNVIHDCLKNTQLGYGGYGIASTIGQDGAVCMNNTFYNNNLDYSWSG